MSWDGSVVVQSFHPRLHHYPSVIRSPFAKSYLNFGYSEDNCRSLECGGICPRTDDWVAGGFGNRWALRHSFSPYSNLTPTISLAEDILRLLGKLDMLGIERWVGLFITFELGCRIPLALYKRIRGKIMGMSQQKRKPDFHTLDFASSQHNPSRKTA